MEFHTPRSIFESHGIDVYARRNWAMSRSAKWLRDRVRRMTVAIKSATEAIARPRVRTKGVDAEDRPLKNDTSPQIERGLVERQKITVRPGSARDSSRGLEVFVVTKDQVPYHATFSQREASQIFDGIVQAGTYREVSVVAISTIQEYRRVLFEAGQAA